MVRFWNDGVFANHLFFAKRLNLLFGYQANAGIKATPLWDSFVITCSLPWDFSFKFIKDSICLFFLQGPCQKPISKKLKKCTRFLINIHGEAGQTCSSRTLLFTTRQNCSVLREVGLGACPRLAIVARMCWFESDVSIV